MSNFKEEEVKRDISDRLYGLGSEVSVRVGQKRTPLPPNIMVFQTFAYLAATTLKPSSNKVLMLFFAHSGYENYVGMDQSTMAEKLGLSDSAVRKAVKELEDSGIIIKTPNPSDKRRIDYFLNPFSAWKGNGFSRAEAIKKLPSNQLDLFGACSGEHQAREVREIKSGSAEKFVQLDLEEEAVKAEQEKLLSDFENDKP